MPFGHNPPELWEALTAAQAEAIPSMVQPLRPVEAERLAERLARLAPGDLEICTFANSGAEVVEAAIKLARARTGRDVILSTRNGFHGKTLGALSATGKPLYQVDFAAPAPGFDYIPYGDIDALAARLEAEGEQIAAFIVEPIQGEGGVVCPPDGYLAAAIELCRRYGVLSIVDEIQTGLGRTGELFASAQRRGPDMLLLAKALGGGMMPIGACIVRPEVWDDRFGLLHSSTFANNNLACRVANATLDMLERDDRKIVREVAANGAYLRSRLEALRAGLPGGDPGRPRPRLHGRARVPALRRARRLGDDGLLQPEPRGHAAVQLLPASTCTGVLTAPLFNDSHVLRLQPPLIAGRDQIDQAVDALGALCEAIARRDYFQHRPAPRRRARTARLRLHLGSGRRPAATPATDRGGPPQHLRLPAPLHRGGRHPPFRPVARAVLGPRDFAAWRDWVKQLGPGFVRHLPTVRSKSGATAEGWIMSVPMLPEDMRGKSRAAATAMIEGAVDLAGERGASRFGLGAFTSIVTRGGAGVVGRGVPITSGNTLTTVTAVVGLQRVAERVGPRPRPEPRRRRRRHRARSGALPR